MQEGRCEVIDLNGKYCLREDLDKKPEERRKVTNLRPSSNSRYPIAGNVNGTCQIWTLEGVYDSNSERSSVMDLVPIPEEQPVGRPKIEMGKRYASGGVPVRLLCVDRSLSNRPVIAEADGGNIGEWKADGTLGRIIGGYECLPDLVEIKEKKRVKLWLNIYPAHCYAHHDKGGAECNATADRIACKEITIEYEVGEGLS